MLDMLDTPPEVLAVRISHQIEDRDLDAVLDRLEPMIEAQEKVHVFVETKRLSAERG